MVQNHHIINVERYHSLLRECSPLVDCGVHYFDLLQWICGCKITEVSGMGTKIEQDFNDISIDYGIANVRLEDGTIGYYEAGWNRGISSNNTKEFIGEKGSISVTLNQFRSSHTEEGDLIELYNNENGSYTAINIPCSYKPMYRQLSSLIDKIEGRETQAPTIEEAYSAFLVAVAADKAAREGIKVKI
jgi:predicted dehydrogenase